jgi:cation diffusion facilitator CzcD-associated flavoprotein CzcO
MNVDTFASKTPRAQERTVSNLPVVVIGAGPTGLAAAAHLRARQIPAVVLEAGPSAGAAVREWSHIRLFSPWRELVDGASVSLLEDTGWTAPDGESFPTGGDWAAAYLQPLADALGDVRYRTRAVGVAKKGRDLMVDADRDTETFTVHVLGPDGEDVVEARAVLDASGTWETANPLGGDGVRAPGEAANATRISYRVPDFRDQAVAARYSGRHVVVAGTGASAKTALIDLVRVAESAPSTRITWLVRRTSVGNAFGGGENDELEKRGELGEEAKAAVQEGPVTTRTAFRTSAVTAAEDGSLTLTSVDGQHVEGVDEVIALTGFRPDLSFLSEVRLDLDSVLQAPSSLAPMIDPNVHSCGTVEPHGAKVLAHPEAGFYLVGMKSYGRAPSFLTLTGYEQVRSVVAEIAGDHEGAARVELVLPDTGVCGGAGGFGDSGDGGCCASSIGTASELLTIGGLGSRGD